MTPGRMIVAALVLPALVLTGTAGAVGVVVAVRRAAARSEAVIVRRAAGGCGARASRRRGQAQSGLV